MKKILLLITLAFSYVGFGQIDDRLTTIEFVEVLNNNKKEALYYFNNNWKAIDTTV